jgi:hypothetical protein
MEGDRETVDMLGWICNIVEMSGRGDGEMDS